MYQMFLSSYPRNVKEIKEKYSWSAPNLMGSCLTYPTPFHQVTWKSVLLFLCYLVHKYKCSTTLSSARIVLTLTCEGRFHAVTSQGRQHPDSPGSQVHPEEGLPRRPQLLRRGSRGHPPIRREVSGQRGAGGCAAQRNGVVLFAVGVRFPR